MVYSIDFDFSVELLLFFRIIVCLSSYVDCGFLGKELGTFFGNLILFLCSFKCFNFKVVFLGVLVLVMFSWSFVFFFGVFIRVYGNVLLFWEINILIILFLKGIEFFLCIVIISRILFFMII